MWLRKFFQLVFMLFCTNSLLFPFLFVRSVFSLVSLTPWFLLEVLFRYILGKLFGWFPWEHYFCGNCSVKSFTWTCCYSSLLLTWTVMWFLCSEFVPYSSTGKHSLIPHPLEILSDNRCQFVCKHEHLCLISQLVFSIREALLYPYFRDNKTKI